MQVQAIRLNTSNEQVVPGLSYMLARDYINHTS